MLDLRPAAELRVLPQWRELIGGVGTVEALTVMPEGTRSLPAVAGVVALSAGRQVTVLLVGEETTWKVGGKAEIGLVRAATHADGRVQHCLAGYPVIE